MSTTGSDTQSVVSTSLSSPCDPGNPKSKSLIVKICLSVIPKGLLKHPTFGAAGFMLLLLAIILYGVHGYYAAKAPEIGSRNNQLQGQELIDANETYLVIEAADQLDEDFTPGSNARQEAAVKAQLRLARFAAAPHTPPAKNIANIFGFYLESVLRLPDADVQCSREKHLAHKVEDANDLGKATEVELVQAEVAYFDCANARAHILNIIRFCRTQSFALSTNTLAPGSPDLCTMNHNTNESPKK